jgi:hypothetical protein
MRQMRYVLTNGTKRQEAVSGRAVSGPDIIGSGDSVEDHVFPGQTEGVVL